uniref:uncharacterized protein si:dkey-22i16.9 n=1 Tax=Scatophagus argus TaxID=75038 RepID=UPI001ED7FC5F|nr:uncharacterized protein si:dkey-22i16.9 [Scatophagus argus]
MARLSDFIHIILSIIIFSGVVGEYANVGGSVKITAHETCRAGEILSLNRLSKTDARSHDQTVARLIKDAWQADEVYAGRIVHNSTSSVILNDVNYNDGGHYVFTCGERDVSHPFHLEVVVPFDRTVTEGAASTLPCHASTVGESVKRVRWEKHGDLVLEQDLSSREVRYGTGFEGKASVSPDWHSRGDLSLTLKGVYPADEGDYVCYSEHEDGKRRTRGDPATVRLRINRSDMSHMTCSPTPCEATEDKPSAGHSVCSVAIVLLVLALAGNIGFILWLKGCRRRGQGPPRSPAARQVNGSATGH